MGLGKRRRATKENVNKKSFFLWFRRLYNHPPFPLQLIIYLRCKISGTKDGRRSVGSRSRCWLRIDWSNGPSSSPSSSSYCYIWAQLRNRDVSSSSSTAAPIGSNWEIRLFWESSAVAGAASHRMQQQQHSIRPYLADANSISPSREIDPSPPLIRHTESELCSCTFAKDEPRRRRARQNGYIVL